MKTIEPTQKPAKVDNDPNLFIVLLMVVVLGMVWVTLNSNPEIRKPGKLIPLLILVVIHLALHWFLGLISNRPKWILWYIIFQGIIAFVITILSGTIAMIFALFMGLIGEAIGLLRITRWGLLAMAYYLVLAMVNLVLITDISQLSGWLFGAIPLVLFVVIYVTLYIRQHEAREQAQNLLKELEAANHQLSEYAAQVEDLTIATERQRLARDLHDTLSQGLAGLILQLEAVDANLKNERQDRALEILQQSMEHARSTLADARLAISDLRENHQEFADLNKEIDAEVTRFENETGLKCQLNMKIPDDLPDSYHEIILRSISEALTNIARHASASQASVNLYQSHQSILVEIQDNGVGFDPNKVKSGHFGLLGLRERARLAGGSLSIESNSEQGTIIKMKLPFEPINE